MEASERELVLRLLAETHARLHALVQGLSPGQRSFRESPDRWSIEECVEHVVLVETFVFDTMQRVLRSAAQPEKQPGVTGKAERILQHVPARLTRVQAPSLVLPTGRWPEIEECLRQFDDTRKRSTEFASTTDADLKSHFFPHPFLGDLDCYQWLLMIAMHCERHVRQMEEIMAAAGYPAAQPVRADSPA